MDAADIMFKMAETYANCKSYQDRGIVRHFEREDVEEYRHRIAFKTNFKRPETFYFEWAETPLGAPETAKPRISAVWSDSSPSTGTQAFRQFHSQTTAQACPSLDYVIASSAGISKGASVMVASYILPTLREKTRALFRLRDLNLEGDAELDGQLCHYLQGHNWGGGEEEFWVDKETFLLKRSRVAIVIKPGVDEKQLAALMKVDPQQAEAYLKFREAQTEERRFWNRFDYHEACVNQELDDEQAFSFDPVRKSDLAAGLAVL
jgi:hypothetical protein